MRHEVPWNPLKASDAALSGGGAAETPDEGPIEQEKLEVFPRIKEKDPYRCVC